MSDLDLNKDYYQILGVSPDAKLGDLKQAHREAVLRHHPDIVGKSSKTLENFRAVQEAYKVLSTPELRQEYDRASRVAKEVVISTVVAEHPQEHLAPKLNYESSARLKGDNRWQMYIQKYKVEHWRKIPLTQRKIARIRPVYSFLSLISGRKNVFLFAMLPIVFTLFHSYKNDQDDGVKYNYQMHRAEKLILNPQMKY